MNALRTRQRAVGRGRATFRRLDGAAANAARSKHPMPRRHPSRWTPWLLALVVLRTFVPTGFMLSVQDGGLAMTLCHGTAPVPAAAMPHAGQHDHAQSRRAHHPASHGDMDGQQHDGRASPCPYALATAACSVEPPPVPDGFERPPPGEVSVESGFVSRSFLRADRIRGPPLRA